MTSTQFRFFLVLSLLTSVAGLIFELRFQSLVPPQLSSAIEKLPGQPSDTKMLLGLVLGLVSLVLGIISMIGMFGFKPWAPKLALTSTLTGGLAILLMGAGLFSSISSALTYYSAILWGSILAIAHTPLYVGFAKASIPTPHNEA